MSGTPRLSNQAASAATAPIAPPVVLVEPGFATGPFRVWTGLGPLDWAGLMDTMEVTDGAEPSVALACESRLVDLERGEVRRYTAADQQAGYPGDPFFEFVPALQEAEIRLPDLWAGCRTGRNGCFVPSNENRCSGRRRRVECRTDISVRDDDCIAPPNTMQVRSAPCEEA